MSETLRRVQTLVMAGEYRVSDHAYEEFRKECYTHQRGDCRHRNRRACGALPHARTRVLALQYQANGRSLGASAGKRKRRVEAAK
jgi:hypothetical protein